MATTTSNHVFENNILSELLQQAASAQRKVKDIENITVIPDPEAKKITIPASMSKLQASKELQKQHENEEQIIEVRRDFETWNWKDALVAIKKVSEQTFGWLDGITETTMFGEKLRPKEIDIVVDVVNGKQTTEKCFYGKFQAAGWEEAEVHVFVMRTGYSGVVVTCKKKYSSDVSKFYDAISEHLMAKSIYRQKTVVITEGQTPSGEPSIDFDIMENKGEENIILNDKEEMVVDRFIIGGLTEKGKRCYLFTGDYGTGKTETAMRIGKEATAKGMTFFYCKDAKVFEEFLAMSKQYQPCIVFLEDVDEIGSGEERNTRMNSILNTLDGVQTKGNDITVLFTTNHEKKINPALRRPGRIDLIVRFEYPEPETAKRIYEVLMSGTRGFGTVDFDEVVAKTPHVQGAVIAQICKRAKKLAEREGKIDTSGMIAAIASMEYQIGFMKEPVEKGNDDKGLLDTLAKRLTDVATEKILNDFNDKF